MSPNKQEKYNFLVAITAVYRVNPLEYLKLRVLMRKTLHLLVSQMSSLTTMNELGQIRAILTFWVFYFL